VDFISLGLLPIIQHMKCHGRVLDSIEAFETLKGDQGNILIEVSINGMCYSFQFPFRDIFFPAFFIFLES